jgi:hypothetical protein
VPKKPPVATLPATSTPKGPVPLRTPTPSNINPKTSATNDSKNKGEATTNSKSRKGQSNEDEDEEEESDEYDPKEEGRSSRSKTKTKTATLQKTTSKSTITTATTNQKSAENGKKVNGNVLDGKKVPSQSSKVNFQDFWLVFLSFYLFILINLYFQDENVEDDTPVRVPETPRMTTLGKKKDGFQSPAMIPLSSISSKGTSLDQKQGHSNKGPLLSGVGGTFTSVVSGSLVPHQFVPPLPKTPSLAHKADNSVRKNDSGITGATGKEHEPKRNSDSSKKTLTANNSSNNNNNNNGNNSNGNNNDSSRAGGDSMGAVLSLLKSISAKIDQIPPPPSPALSWMSTKVSPFTPSKRGIFFSSYFLSFFFLLFFFNHFACFSSRE